MQCPKDKGVELENVWLSGTLPACYCSTCGGSWIPPEDYYNWQQQHRQSIPMAPPRLDVDYEPAPLDAKGALCPDCHSFLSRARVGTEHPFYVERCGRCGGVWCDHGEWEVLQKLGLHTSIEQLFTSEWQSKVKELEYADRERRATIEKLGPDLAQQVFDLTERLEQHPNGDFGVAYLMRRFEK